MIFSVEKGSRQASIIGGTLFVIAVLGLVFLVEFDWYISQPKLPLYPHAEEVSINEADIVANSTGTISTTVYTLVFQSNDAPDHILAFYRDALAKQGWELERTPPDTLIYHRRQADDPLMGLVVTIGSGEQPKPYHIVLTMGNYTAMDRVHALGR